ncbi:MAG: SAM-dependent methyltransferase [Roseburia sp.]|nr:SAM-dependent methyltransferase [Roseburia sp.]
MAKNEAVTDLWVHDMLVQADIKLDPQGSSIKELNEALKTASKRGTRKSGYPEYCGVVKDFILLIEDKASLQNHIIEVNGVVADDTKSVTDYAVNGALFYGRHLARLTTYKKLLCFGVSGNEKHHRITPIFVDERENYHILPDVESFISFNEDNIEEYYVKEILNEKTDKEKELAEILRDASVLHEDLRNYGNLQDQQKPLVVSGILLALNERKDALINMLTGDDMHTDGQIIYETIETALKRANVAPEVKRDKILHQFSVIQDTAILNTVNSTLGETPLKYYTKFLYQNIFKAIKYTDTSEDYLGRFYGEFMHYSGGDGQTLGIVLTPKHITELFCDLIDLKPTDVVLDPTCGTGGFLVAAMHKMLKEATSESQRVQIRKNQLHGIELQPHMFTIATTNMILRGDGKSNLLNTDFFAESAGKIQLNGPTVGLMNPPYSQGSKKNPQLYEISFVEHLLDSLVPDGRCAVIVPQSTFTGKSKDEQDYKSSIMKKHTLEGVITLNKDTFYGVGVMPCIAVFTAHQPHLKDKVSKFINFEDDGWEVSAHIGLLETESAKDKKQHLLDVWFDRAKAETKFCVESTVRPEDEWLHSFYYFNDEIPADVDFEKTIGDYLTFEFSMVMQGRKYLFENGGDKNAES